MPRGDGTGPIGARIGSGLGPCGAGRGFRSGMGFNKGYGRGRFGFMSQQQIVPHQQISQDNDQELLKMQLASIEQEEKMLQLEKQELQKKLKN